MADPVSEQFLNSPMILREVSVKHDYSSTLHVQHWLWKAGASIAGIAVILIILFYAGGFCCDRNFDYRRPIVELDG
jgi:hypothetical protein